MLVLKYVEPLVLGDELTESLIKSVKELLDYVSSETFINYKMTSAKNKRNEKVEIDVVSKHEFVDAIYGAIAYIDSSHAGEVTNICRRDESTYEAFWETGSVVLHASAVKMLQNPRVMWLLWRVMEHAMYPDARIEAWAYGEGRKIGEYSSQFFRPTRTFLVADSFNECVKRKGVKIDLKQPV